MKVGVLALQGAVAPHLKMIKACGAEPVKVLDFESLNSVDKLILPGGESTTMLKLIVLNSLWHPLLNFFKTKPTWGTCAGAILLADTVTNPNQESFKVIDIKAQRNAYGSQLESFKSEIEIDGIVGKLEVDFIRAPKLLPLNEDVQILSKNKNDCIVLRQKNILVSSFHVELGQDTRLHQYFIDSI